jgi:RNA polymerase sigma factor (sigma-70 family)
MATAQADTLLRHIQRLAGACVGQETDRQLLDELIARGNEAAFAELVARHGPMVLRVCRRVLHHEQDVEDAFQAVFLVLARNARSIHKREALAGWLHGVAHRTAMKARRSAARQRALEARLRQQKPSSAASPTWSEVQSVLDEEIQHLPEAFRSAFVLCVLQGKSGPEAAAELGCKEGTVKSRLNRARRALQRRLAARGIQLATLLAALSVAESSVRATVSAALTQSTIRFGLLVAAGGSAAGQVPTHVAALATGVTRAMFLTKTKLTTALLLAASLLIAGAAALAQVAPPGKPPAGSEKAEVQSAQPKPTTAKEAGKEQAADMPIAGQIVDLEGKPVAGATLRVLEVQMGHRDDLGPWLEAIKARRVRCFDLEQQYLKKHPTAVLPKATTDAEGRFRLTGIARNRLVIAQLDGPGVTSQKLRILTRPGKPLEAVEFEGKPEYNDPRRFTIYYGASFRHAASPGREIVGVVRDKSTKKPLTGVSIRSFKLATHPVHYQDGQEIVQTTTDAQGRYRLQGMPKGEGNKIKVVPPDDLPYLATYANVPNPPGLGPVTVDFEIKRGVWIEGKITDKVTGKPVKWGVEYVLLYSNPNRRDYPGADGHLWYFGKVKEDGSYRVVGLPGPGMIAAYSPKNNYLRVDQRQDEFGSKGLSREECPDRIRGSNCGAITRINPAIGVEKVKQDVTLDPGWKLTGNVLGPDGKPLAATRSFLLVGHSWDSESTKTAKFTAWFNPHEANEMLFQHPEKGLIGVAQLPKENGGSVTVRMGPGAAVTGRLVDAAGKPRPGVELEVSFRPKGWGSWFDYSPQKIKTDREGRFRIEALQPDGKFRLFDGKGKLPFGGALRSAETKDLGDVHINPGEAMKRGR